MCNFGSVTTPETSVVMIDDGPSVGGQCPSFIYGDLLAKFATPPALWRVIDKTIVGVGEDEIAIFQYRQNFLEPLSPPPIAIDIFYLTDI